MNSSFTASCSVTFDSILFFHFTGKKEEKSGKQRPSDRRTFSMSCGACTFFFPPFFCLVLTYTRVHITAPLCAATLFQVICPPPPFPQLSHHRENHGETHSRSSFTEFLKYLFKYRTLSMTFIFKNVSFFSLMFLRSTLAKYVFIYIILSLQK